MTNNDISKRVESVVRMFGDSFRWCAGFNPYPYWKVRKVDDVGTVLDESLLWDLMDSELKSSKLHTFLQEMV